MLQFTLTGIKQASLHDNYPEIILRHMGLCGPPLNRTPEIEWYMELLGVKNGHKAQKADV